MNNKNANIFRKYNIQEENIIYDFGYYNSKKRINSLFPEIRTSEFKCIKKIQNAWRKFYYLQALKEKTNLIIRPDVLLISRNNYISKERIKLLCQIQIKRDSNRALLLKTYLINKNDQLNKVKTIQHNWVNTKNNLSSSNHFLTLEPQKMQCKTPQIIQKQIPDSKLVMSKQAMVNKLNNIKKIKTIQDNYRLHIKLPNQNPLKLYNNQQNGYFISKIKKINETNIDTKLKLIQKTFKNIRKNKQKECLQVPNTAKNILYYSNKKRINNTNNNESKIKQIQKTYKHHLHFPKNIMNQRNPIKLNKDAIETVPQYITKIRRKMFDMSKTKDFEEVIGEQNETKNINNDVLLYEQKVKTIQKEYRKYSLQSKSIISNKTIKPLLNNEFLNGNYVSKIKYKIDSPIKIEKSKLFENSYLMKERKLINNLKLIKKSPVKEKCFVIKNNMNDIALYVN